MVEILDVEVERWYAGDHAPHHMYL